MIKMSKPLASVIAAWMMAFATTAASAQAVESPASPKGLFTSSLYTSSPDNYPICTVTNITTKPVTVTITMLDVGGNVLTNAASTSVGPGKTFELAKSSYTGISRCTFALADTAAVRANLSIIHWDGAGYQIFAVSEAN